MERKKILHETKVPSMETAHGRQVQGDNDKEIMFQLMQKELELRSMLAICFAQPYRKEMESKQYQKDHYLRRVVMDKLRILKSERDGLINLMTKK